MTDHLVNAAATPPVLVVGAGPVGLTTATLLRRHGVPVRCVEQAERVSTRSKALLVWPRTLEVLRQLGAGAYIKEAALPVGSFRYYSSAREVVRLSCTGPSQPVVLPQPNIEELLTNALAMHGGQIERGTRLQALAPAGDRVVADLRTPRGIVREEFSYVVGCDGAGSTVRGLSGVEFEGATYPNTFMLADAMVSGDLSPDAVHYYCSPRGVLVLICLPSGRFRVFTSGSPDLKPEDVTLELIQRLVDERGPGGLVLHDPTWISTFSVHSRRASSYRAGRVFLAGDAAHIHSPAGGQGLNTGITDAHNLAWKLALAWHGHAGEALLDSYQAEREQVAAAVVRQADLQTRAWLIKKRHRIWARDTAAKLASAAGVFESRYLPWLAGVRTGYRYGAVDRRRDDRRPRYRELVRGFTAGALLADPPVWDAARDCASTLRSSLSDTRYTLLVRPRRTRQGRAGGPTVAETAAPFGGLVEVRILGSDGVLREPGPETRIGDRGRISLVRPDHYVAVDEPATGHARVRAHLVDYLRAPSRSVTAVAGRRS